MISGFEAQKRVSTKTRLPEKFSVALLSVQCSYNHIANFYHKSIILVFMLFVAHLTIIIGSLKYFIKYFSEWHILLRKQTSSLSLCFWTYKMQLALCLVLKLIKMKKQISISLATSFSFVYSLFNKMHTKIIHNFSQFAQCIFHLDVYQLDQMVKNCFMTKIINKLSITVQYNMMHNRIVPKDILTK